MSSRHSLALASTDNVLPLSQLAENLYLASLEVEADGNDPSADAAVMLIGMQVAFLVHSDFLTKLSYDRLVDTCKQNDDYVYPQPHERH